MPVDLRKGHPLYEKYEAAKDSVQKAGVDRPVAVYLVADFSISMTGFYNDGRNGEPSTMQDLGDRILALSATVDDDGEVPVVLFDTSARKPVNINVHRSAGAMDEVVRKAGSMGGTDYAPAMKVIRELHRKKGNGNPGLVIFQTDGNTGNPGAAERQIKESAPEPLFWQFMGYGYDERMVFLEGLDTMPGRVIDNAGFFHAGQNPKGMSDAELYDQIIGGEFSQQWLAAYEQQFGGFAAPRRGLFGRR